MAAAGEAAGQVGHLVLGAVREHGAFADDEARAPGVGAKGPVALGGPEGVVGPLPGEAPVQPGRGRIAEGAGGGVELGHVDRRAEGLAAGRDGAGVQLAPQVGDQLAGAELQAGAPSGAAQRPHQVGVGQGAGVVPVEGVAVLAAQVSPGPVGGGPQPAGGPPVVEPPGGQGQLHGPELHVVLPGVLGVVGVREGRDQLADAGRAGHGEHRGAGPQQGPGPPAVPVALHLGAQGERGGHPAGQVGADPRPRRGGPEHRAVLDEVLGVARPHRQGVVGLGQPPHVVVAQEAEALTAGAEPDLRVEDPVALVPDLVQPAQPVAGLGGQGAVPAVQAPLDDQQLGHRVGGGVGELDEVAGVEPAALDVHRAADRPERGRGHVAAVALEHRGGVHRGPAVGQVGRSAVQPPRDLGAVALDLEEVDGVVDELGEQGLAAGDAERRRGRGQAVDHDPVAAGPAQGAEVDGVHGPVAGVPAAGRPADPAREHGPPAVVHDPEPGPDGRGLGQQERPLGLAGRVPDLVDPDDAADGPWRGAGGRPGERAGHERDPERRHQAAVAERDRRRPMALLDH